MKVVPGIIKRVKSNIRVARLYGLAQLLEFRVLPGGQIVDRTLGRT